MSDVRFYVGQDTLEAYSESSWQNAKMSKMGFQIVTDFYTQMAIERRVYQVKAGTISVPIVGDVVITDTAAEMCADAADGTTIIPVYCNVSFNLAAGTLFETAGKSVATVSSAGTAFVPLPLYSGGVAATSTARAQTAGAVTVTAETATTTPRHFSWSQPIAAGAWPTTYDWEPRTPPILNGPRCFYVQIAGTGTGPSYFAHFDYIELPTTAVS
ncbi:MAG: hypothetical protein ACYTAO_24005 [Planctomycetota bacterium]|jgi:hypothetical protein